MRITQRIIFPKKCPLDQKWKMHTLWPGLLASTYINLECHLFLHFAFDDELYLVMFCRLRMRSVFVLGAIRRTKRAQSQSLEPVLWVFPAFSVLPARWRKEPKYSQSLWHPLDWREPLNRSGYCCRRIPIRMWKLDKFDISSF